MIFAEILALGRKKTIYPAGIAEREDGVRAV